MYYYYVTATILNDYKTIFQVLAICNQKIKTLSKIQVNLCLHFLEGVKEICGARQHNIGYCVR